MDNRPIRPDHSGCISAIVAAIIVGIIGPLIVYYVISGGIKLPPPSSSPSTTTNGSGFFKFSGDRNTDSQTLGVSPNDLLHRAASGDGWQVDNVTFTVASHVCVDLDGGLSDQDAHNRIHAPIEWISHDISGVTRVYIAGSGTAQGPATIYSESSSCPRR
jgi:hypothetical protein